MNWWHRLLGKAELELPTPVTHDTTPAFIPEPDQVQRKAWAEAKLRREGVPINQSLPMIESESETTLRPASEIAGRLLALSTVAGMATEDERQPVEKFAEAKGAKAYFTAGEAKFFSDPSPTMHDRAQFSWQYECAFVLRWALKLSDDALGYPDTPCSVSDIIDTVCTTEDLTKNGVRSIKEILDEADLIYRYHWAVRQAGLDGKEAPCGLHGGVVMERHRALNWLIRCNDEDDWDEITTDT
jgi:hypothetical protein